MSALGLLRVAGLCHLWWALCRSGRNTSGRSYDDIYSLRLQLSSTDVELLDIPISRSSVSHVVRSLLIPVSLLYEMPRDQKRGEIRKAKCTQMENIGLYLYVCFNLLQGAAK